MRGIFGVYLASPRSLSDGQAAECLLDAAGNLLTSSAAVAVATATRTDVSVAAASTLVLAANTARKPGSVIACDTTAISYFKLGTGASASDYIAAVDGKTTVAGLFNVPDGYLGAVYAYGASATGSWRVTEFA